MATYDIDNLPSQLRSGDVINCPYSGGEKTITLPKGRFKLECWGARGGDNRYSGRGGYSVGNYYATTEEVLHLVCGGHGTYIQDDSTYHVPGGYNGGGGAQKFGWLGSGASASGGGATHIALSSGVLSTFSYKKQDVIMVAGGGGGSYYSSHHTAVGGNGGGLTGANGTTSKYGSESMSGYGGKGGSTPSNAGGQGGYSSYTHSYYGDPGGFGYGGNSHDYGGDSDTCGSGGGGGGWYGGGGTSDWSGLSGHGIVASGGGGSGYVNPSLANASTVQQAVSTNPDSDQNGYIRITVLDVRYLNIPVKVNAHWHDAPAGTVKVNGHHKVLTRKLTKVSGHWK